MAPLFSLISQLTPKKMFWALKVRLVRCYEFPTFGKDKDDIFSMECIFHDREGSRIHATIKKQILKSVALKFKEGNLYAVKDVIVAENSMKMKTTTNKFKINFVQKTQVCEIFDETFPSFIYEFKPFAELKSEDMVDKTYLFGEIRVSNTYHVTKMIINEDSDVVANFRNRLSLECKTPNTVSTMTLPSANTILEEISTSKDNFRTIEQISENHEVGSFWILAKVAVVENNGDWYYLSCVKCPKKMTPVADSFYCERCDHFDVNGKLRFKIQVPVVDDRGNALFLMWDRECIELIGKTAMELRSQGLNEEFIGGEMPKKIDDLVDRKVLFKIQESDILSKFKNTEHGELKEICSSEDEVTTPFKTTPKTVAEDVINDSNLKRSLLDEFSSTAPGKKMKTVIKQEKD
ncbi:replication protein A 70 kDa DNA-binding subunit B-like [Henckelia pumila]|uniref:replication protein A 70 kDa DNA-binding subunit B-like n=1 Tax=Henckelia pumila TaxID=405737 RepID=UPI003C6DE172